MSRRVLDLVQQGTEVPRRLRRRNGLGQCATLFFDLSDLADWAMAWRGILAHSIPTSPICQHPLSVCMQGVGRVSDDRQPIPSRFSSGRRANRCGRVQSRMRCTRGCIRNKWRTGSTLVAMIATSEKAETASSSPCHARRSACWRRARRPRPGRDSTRRHSSTAHSRVTARG